MNTERFLEKALLEMLKTRTVTQIFVVDLLKEVGICKATFYKHFCDKYDLLQRCFQNAYYGEVLAHAENFEQFVSLSLAAFRKSPKVVLHAMPPEDPSGLFVYHSELLCGFLRKECSVRESEERERLIRVYARTVTEVTVDWLSAPRLTAVEEVVRLVRALYPVGLSASSAAP